MMRTQVAALTPELSAKPSQLFGGAAIKEWAPILFPFLALLPAGLGGALAPWSEAVLFLAVGTLLVCAPPRRFQDGWTNLLCFFLLLGACLALLPIKWLPWSPWRVWIESGVSLQLPATRSPQPWLTLEGIGLLAVGLAWAYLVGGQAWTITLLGRTARLFAVLGTILTIVALVSYCIEVRVPFWPKVINGTFGFFPNRNQTASLLVLLTLITSAALIEDFSKKRRFWLFWLPALAIQIAGVALTYSRAGIALLIGGSLLLSLLAFSQRSFRRGVSLLIALHALILLGCVLADSRVIQRFNPWNASTEEFRSIIQRDALELSGKTALLGVGLGNFEAAFRISRGPSRARNYNLHPENDWIFDVRTLHPESDWLWVAVEMGWLAVGGVLVILLLWIKRCRPLCRKEQDCIRIAAFVCGVVFAIHGLVDVSGHRIGSAFPAIFLMSLAISPREARPEHRWAAWIFRFAGLLLLLLGAGFAMANVVSLPTRDAFRVLRTQVDQSLEANAFETAKSQASRAIDCEPLEWSIYFRRAMAEALSGSDEEAIRDFRRARFLQPAWAKSCVAEGQLWLQRHKDQYAIEAFTMALTHSPDGGATTYRSLLSTSIEAPRVHEELRQWGWGNVDYLLVSMEFASSWEFTFVLNELLFGDTQLSSFTEPQKKRFFELWAQKADLKRLQHCLEQDPHWYAFGSLNLAEGYATKGFFEDACRIALPMANYSTLLNTNEGHSSAITELEYDLNPYNLEKGLKLSKAYVRQGNFDRALHTVELLILRFPHQRSLLACKAEIQASKGDWSAAWQSFKASRQPRPSVPQVKIPDSEFGHE